MNAFSEISLLNGAYSQVIVHKTPAYESYSKYSEISGFRHAQLCIVAMMPNHVAYLHFGGGRDPCLFFWPMMKTTF